MVEVFNLLNDNFYISLLIICFFGLCLGSFLNVVIYRLPLMMDYEIAELVDSIAKDSGDEVKNVLKNNKNINLSFPSSHCPLCKSKIPLYLNIPIIGYLITGGKCFNCKESYSFRYLFIEIFISIIWCIFFYKYGLTIDFLFYSTLFSLLTVSGVIDLKYKILPDKITFPLIFMTYLYISNGYSEITIKESIFSGIFSYILIYIIVNIYQKLRNIDIAMGEGDIKLYLLAGSLVGTSLILPLILISVSIGILSYLLLLIFNKEENLDYNMPFGPSIITSLFLIVFFNDFIKECFYFL